MAITARDAQPTARRSRVRGPRRLLDAAVLVGALVSASAAALTSQTLTFGALAGKTFGAAPFGISATASSGLPVSFASLTTSVCTVSGTTVTIVAAGTCTIRASQAGNATYAAAPTVDQSFAVAKAAQTITFGALASRAFGSGTFALSATASSGLAVTFTSTTTTICAVNGPTVTLVAAGTCTIQAAQAGNGNWSAAPNVAQSFSITKGTQTIAFGALSSRAFGSGTFALSATASSGLAVAFTSTTTANCTVSGTTVTLVAAGTCTIQAAQAGNANWNAAANVTQSFSVTKGNQTTTFGALANRALGSGTFTLAATASSTLTVTFVSLTASACTVSTKTVTLVTPGTCTIQAAQSGNANWNAAPNVNQSFTVTPAAQTINFPAIAPQIWGSVGPNVSATATSALAVAYLSLTPTYCSVFGTSVTLLEVGSCTILATQAGNANYLAANASQTFAIIVPLQFAFFDAFSAGTAPWGIVAGDFGTDGKPDVAVANTGGNTVSLLFGTGDGTLTTGTTLTSGNFPQALVAGDLNGDGHPDLIVANARDNTINIYLGNGNSTFGPPQTRAVRASPTALALADLNGDGKLDLVVANGYTGDYSLNYSQGSSVEVFLGNGDGTFQASSAYGVISNAQGVAIADVNGDGKPDLLVTNGFSGLFTVLLGRGDGTFTTGNIYATQSGPSAIAVADFNGDGKRDVVVANSQSGTLSLFPGNGNGTFGAPTIVSVDSGLLSVVAVDFNGDGRTDLAVATNSGVYVMAGLGNGTFSPPVWLIFGSSPGNLAVADLDGDGRPDLIEADYASNAVAVFLNVGVVGAGATIAAQTGTPQSAAVNAAFAVPMSVLVRSPANQPVPGQTVVFSAPPLGPSGYFTTTGSPAAQATTDGGGIATAPSFVASATPGTFGLLASIGSASTNFALTITGTANQAPAFLSAPLPNGVLNAPYAYAVAASGSPAPTLSTLANSLPAGLTLDGPTGLVAGTPSTAGTYIGTLTASNGVPPNATQAFSVTISTGTQTITFGAIANVTLGVPPFTIAATATSGLPVTFTSLTPSVCTVSGNTVTIVAPGTCTLQASQAGNSTYAPAPNVSRSFTVAKPPQTITFGALFNRNLGSAPFTVSATASSGLAVTFASLTSPVCTVSGATVSLLATGTCTVRAAQAGNATYAAAPNVDQGFTVKPAGADQAPTITFKAPANTSVYVAPAIIPLYATASDPDGTIARVEFYNGSTMLGSITTPPYSFVWKNVATGAYSLTAKAYDDLGVATSTAVVTVTVNATGSPVAFGQPLPASIAGSFIPGDFNGDGKLDLAYPGNSGLGVWRGNGNGTFADGGSAIVSGPCLNLPLSQPAFGAGVVGDFNGDGKKDVAIVGSGPACIGIPLSNGDGTWRPYVGMLLTFQPTVIAAGDFNGDGKLDVATGNDDGTIAIFLGNGDGTLQAPVLYPAGSAFAGIVAGDFTGDGKLDLLLTNVGDATLRFLRGNGNGTFQAGTTIALGGTRSPAALVAGDFNGDGKLDVAFTDASGSGVVTVLIGNGDGTFQPLVDYPAGSVPSQIVVGDLNGDGWLDLAVTNPDWTSTVSVLVGNGNGTFRAPLTLAVPGSPYYLAAGDFTGDGKLDLVAGIGPGSVTSTSSVLVNLTGVATQAPLFTNGIPPDGYGGMSYSFSFTASGTPSPVFRFSPSTNLGSFTLTPTGVLANIGVLHPDIYHGTIIASNGAAPDATYDFTIVVREAPQTITFPPISDFPFANCLSTCAFNVTVTSSTGILPVLLSSLTPTVCTVDASGKVTILTIGTCVIRAEQPGDLFYAPAPTIDRGFAVIPATFTIAVTSPADYAGFVAPANITVSATAIAAQGYAITNVAFFHDGILIGAATTPPFSITWANVGVGTYSLVAQSTQHAAGAPNDIVTASYPVTAIVQSVADATTVSLTSPTAGSRYYAPATIALTATAANPSGSVAKVDFYNGPFEIGSSSTVPYAFTWTGVRTGAYTLTAKATSASGVVTTSSPINVTVDLDAAFPIAAFTFNEPWDSSGLATDIIGNIFGERRGGVSQLSAPSLAPKPDTCKAANFTGGSIDVTGLDLWTAAGAKSSVAFWMNWNGADGAMPVSFATEGLLFSAGNFGFTTGSGDVFGIASAGLANGWHHVAAEFNNGGVIGNRLSVDGASQGLTQRVGTPNTANAVVGSAMRLGGQSGSTSLRFTGQLDDVELFEGGLDPTHIAALATAASPCAPLTVLLAMPYNGATYTAPATIEFAAGASTQNGFVNRMDFFNGPTLLATPGGVFPPFTYRWTDVPAGTYTLTAKAYDTTGATASSAPAIVTVNPAPSAHATVSIVAPQSGSTFYAGGTVAIVANITTAPSYVVKQAQFFANSSLLGALTASPWTFNVPNMLPGTYVLTVAIVDNAGYRATSAPVTITILANLPPVVSLTAPSEGQSFSATGPITLSAAASDPDGTVAKVEFFAGSALIGTKTTSPYTISWSGAAAGSYTLTAKATDNVGASSTSAPVHIAVASTPTITLIAPPAGSSYGPGQPILMTAQAGTPGHPLARIDFLSDGVVKGSVSIPAGPTSAVVSYTWNGAPNGIHALSAKATATDAFSVSSATVSVEVSDLAVTLAEPFPGQAYQPPADIRITANPTETGGTIAQVDFYGDGALLGSRTTAPYTFVWSGAAVGAHTVSATAKDGGGYSASSAAIPVTVLAVPAVQVDAGIDGVSVADDNVSISGTVQAPLNSAVTVNGKGAALDRNGRFFVDNVQLQPGANAVTLLLNTLDGAPVARTINVGSSGAAPFQVTLDPQEGLAPLSATMTISNRGNVAFQRIEIDINDDGTPEQTLTSLTDNQVVLALTFPNPGTYTIRVTAFGPTNNVIYLTRRKIRAFDPRELGTITASVFNGMLDRLRQGNIPGALNTITGGANSKYQAIFISLQASLSSIVEQIGAIQAISVTSDIAELSMLRTSNNGPQTFPIYLIRSEDGIWRIDGM